MIAFAHTTSFGDGFFYVCVAISVVIAIVGPMVRANWRSASPRRRPHKPGVVVRHQGRRKGYRINQYGEVFDED